MDKKLTSNEVQETGRYFNPKSQIVSSLPDPKSVRDFSEVWQLNNKGTYDSYKMLQGQWVKTGSNNATVTQINQPGSGGSGGSGTAGVDSVNSRTGVIVLTSSDVGLGNVTNDAQLKASQLSTDEGLGASLTSDLLVPSQKAAKIYNDYHRLNFDGHNSAEVYASALRLDEGSSSTIYSGLIFDNGDSLIGY